jgi:NTP pyrophosphatase (non-canonical NTP hydrolase)
MEKDYLVSELISDSYNTAVEKGWWEAGTEREVGTALMLMVTELAEAMEEHRHGRALDEIWYAESGKPEGVPVELADVIIRICDLAGHHKIPLNRALREKLAYNKTRPYRHGNKKA